MIAEVQTKTDIPGSRVAAQHAAKKRPGTKAPAWVDRPVLLVFRLRLIFSTLNSYCVLSISLAISLRFAFVPNLKSHLCRHSHVIFVRPVLQSDARALPCGARRLVCQAYCWLWPWSPGASGEGDGGPAILIQGLKESREQTGRRSLFRHRKVDSSMVPPSLQAKASDKQRGTADLSSWAEHSISWALDEN